MNSLHAFPSTRSCLRRAGRLGLGAFVVWQLIYLAVANSVETVEVVTHRFPETHRQVKRWLDENRSEDPSRPAIGLATLVRWSDRWGQLTEQPQRWSLFAPNVSDQTGFLALELRWHDVDQSYWLLSANEPQDPSSYVRVSGNRLRSIEQNLALTFTLHAGESERDARRRWGQQIQQKLARDCDILLVWTALQVDDFLLRDPRAPYPDEVIVHARGFEIAPPDSPRAEMPATPYSVAVARWRPTGQYPPDVLPVEVFDPVSQQFVYQPWSQEPE